MQWLNLEDNVNLLSLIGAILIILITLVIVGRMFKQMKEKKGESELSEHSWDGIGEYKNAVPTGWAVVFFLTIVWAIWYFLWGYPLNSFSSIGQYNEEVATHNTKFEEKFKNLSPEDKIAMGQNIFLVQCSACHGITGDGINGKAQNLNIWGSEEGIINVIKHGSKGMNFPGGEMLGA
ncbi:c-type cytochrome, partial [Campylobacter jejuni]|nr:c-type cytochrome [Campylobacter jejuni]